MDGVRARLTIPLSVKLSPYYSALADFAGRVVEIRHTAEYLPRNVQTLDQRSDQVFAVKVALDPAAELRPGMAAFVTLPESAGAGG